MKHTEIVSLWQKAQQGGYALGSFSPRNTFLIDAIISAAQNVHSPVMVQISSNEMRWFEIAPAEFAEAYFRRASSADVPVILHLDHTYDFDTVKNAIEAGFESVMIDGSKLPFEENAALTKEVCEYAHARGRAVEGELGNIGGADKLETGGDERLYTVPEQALEFVRRTGVDALAVSVGTAHGVYPTANPKIDFERLRRIHRLIPDTPLVLHGGSGLPEETVRRAVKLDGEGGIVKLNIATDLELIFQKALGIGRIPNREVLGLDPEKLREADREVRSYAEARMRDYLFSAGRA